jgi:DNA-binding XRE family transcriptional regulator
VLADRTLVGAAKAPAPTVPSTPRTILLVNRRGRLYSHKVERSDRDITAIVGYSAFMADPGTPSRSETDRLIGRLVGDAREDAHLSQIDAAGALGVHQSLIAKIEAGQRRLYLAEAVRLADLYGCGLDAFNPEARVPRARTGIRRRRIPTRTRGAAG